MATVRMPRTEPVRPSVPEERSRHLRVVGPRERVRARLRLTPRLGIGLVVLLFVALFAVAASHALLIAGQGRLDRLDQQVAEEQARYEQLRAELAALESPERILAEAEAMGMESAGETDWLAQSQPIAATEADNGEPETPTVSYSEIKPHLNPTP